MISDVQFLVDDRTVEVRDHFIYLYRADSGSLKSRVRKRILALGHELGWTAVSPEEGRLYGAITRSSLFPILVVCDLGDGKAKSPEGMDVGLSLRSIAAGGLENHAFLMASDDNAVILSETWRSAIASVTYIEEPIVTKKNIKQVLGFLTAASDLGDLSDLGKERIFIDHFDQFVSEPKRTVLEISKEIDHFVLVEMGNPGLSRSLAEIAAKRHALKERVSEFLNRRDVSCLTRLLLIVNDLHISRGWNVSEVIARLYAATASIVGGRDRRYKRNRDESPIECAVWGLMLLSWGQSLTTGNLLVALNGVCREYMNIVDYQAWLGRTDHWQEIAAQFVQSKNIEVGRVAKARLDLVNALQDRLESLRGLPESGWIELLLEQRRVSELQIV